MLLLICICIYVNTGFIHIGIQCTHISYFHHRYKFNVCTLDIGSLALIYVFSDLNYLTSLPDTEILFACLGFNM